jgi:simple sugar transport system ATP-binding protein
MAKEFLSLKNISKHYVGVQALNAVDFEILAGEIHCLVGENGSGKSTLIKIIAGVEQPDPGSSVQIHGQAIHGNQAIEAIRNGIEVIYQDLSLFPNLTVAENIALSETIAKGRKWVQWKEVDSIARVAMSQIEANLPLDALISEVSLADQQITAICRALTHDLKLIIMDEPTTALTRQEVDALFRVVKNLQSKGIATMFVSHKLDEVFEIAERVSILRDGVLVGTYPRDELDDEKLIYLMTGKKLDNNAGLKTQTGDGVLLNVVGFCKQDNFKDIDFQLYPGEILGITGLLGSGRTELAQAIFGLNPPDCGEIYLDGQPVHIRNVQDAIHHGIAYVPENRLVQGLVMKQSVGKNIIITFLGKLLNRWGLIHPQRSNKNIQQWIDNLNIRVPAVEAPVETLSGGNQQRVVLAKWMATNPKILILDGPTVGVDVAAKRAIHKIIRELADQGVGILIISDELQEVMYNCNRILVMHKGRLKKAFDPKKTTETSLKQYIQTISLRP